MRLADGVYRIKNARTKNYVTLLSKYGDLVSSEQVGQNSEEEEWQIKFSDTNEKCTFQNRALGTFAGHDPEERHVRGTETKHVWRIKKVDGNYAIHTGTGAKSWCFENDRFNSQVFLREESPEITYYQWIFEGTGTIEQLPLDVETAHVIRQRRVSHDKLEWEEVTKFLSDRLPRVPGATFMHERACLPGTRATLLKTISEWTMSSDSLYLLTAPAGAGKSTIAHTVASPAQGKGILGGSFFLHRDFNDRRDAHLVINSLAFQLAHFDLEIAKNIRRTLTRDPDLPSSSTVHNKFSGLIVNPVKNSSAVKGPILLVIDDLDALVNGNTTHSNIRQAFLACIAGLEPELPSALKIFMTSRPEPDITLELASFCQCPLGLDTKETQDDLKKYAMNCMTKIARRYKYLGNNWPGSEAILDFVRKACGLFIWIHTVYLFVMQRDAGAWLKVALSPQPLADVESELDKLYTKALLDHPDVSDSVFYDRFQKVVGGIVVLYDPLSSASLDSLLKLSFYSDDIVSSLQSFLYNTGDDTVRFIHPSFPEFLSDHTRCKDDKLRIDKDFQHCELAKACLAKMHEMLRKNICNLDSSQFNSEIVDLDERIKKNISKELQYACQHWAYHLASLSELDTQVYELVKRFLQNDLLYWLEVLSLLQKMTSTLISLDYVQEKLETHSNANAKELDQLVILVHDAKHFVHEFYTPIGQSSMHIYHSALPFTPQQTIFYETYSSKLERNIKILNGPSLQWSTSAHMTMCVGHTSQVTCMAFSPDGSIIVSCAQDSTLRLWDVKYGVAIGKPLKSHTYRYHCYNFTSVAFSPDGSKIVSGSMEKTASVCLWDVKSGAAIGEPLKGHKKGVSCVAFSPDGSKIVSGSVDGSLCLWDAKSDATIGEPLNGHSDDIMCVAFSSDSSKFVSGSYNRLVCLWDADSGAVIGKPIICHSDMVRCVAFCPDGLKFVSCSDDRTLCLWDGKSGAAIGKPLTGHSGEIYYVVFSPDGSQIVSGSEDNTLRLWDGKFGVAIGEPLKGHSGKVYCIAFSPDGSKFVSGSEDKTLCIWNAKSGITIRALNGHRGSIRCVAYSPDGSKIVSGSDDSALCIWNCNPSTANTEVLNYQSYVDKIKISPDGLVIVSILADGTLNLWDAVLGVAIGKPMIGHSASIPFNAVVFSHDSLKIVSGSYDTTLRLWNAKSGVAIGESLNGHSDLVNCIAFSPDDSKFVSGSYDKSLCLWDAKSGAAIGEPLTGHSTGIDSVQFSPDGTKIASRAKNTVCLWDSISGAAIGELLTGSIEIPISSTYLAFSSDGLHVTIGKSLMWNVSTLSLLTADQAKHAKFPYSTSQSQNFQFHETRWLVDNSGHIICWIPFANTGGNARTAYCDGIFCIGGHNDQFTIIDISNVINRHTVGARP
ncbi:WD40 repeat-like protein [Rickenella mellea]|uniref:WD40 repeat-like protein n=1 Tax=Rickenella mellea TaxID=50990 RepID=A0A4Y7Q8M5_9AGAM|nr:WD40 repeat-like protein [Rickenella mellea]